MRQESGQSIADFHSQVNNLRGQLSAVDPQLKCFEDVALFVSYRDCRKFMHFMMTLRVDSKPTQASLLHRTPIPTLDAARVQHISKETRQSTMQVQSPNMVVAATPQSALKFPPRQSTSQSSFEKLICNCCKKLGHSSNCYKLENINQSKAHFQQAATVASSSSSTPKSFTENLSESSTLTAVDVEALIH